MLDAFRSAPMRDLDAIVGDRPILVLAPHPDDESLACGGLIAAACASGREVFVAVLTDGSQSHPGSRAWPPAALAALRAAEARAAVAALGLPENRIFFLGQADTKVPTAGPDFLVLVDRLAGWARAHRIGTVCTTWVHDPHCDHEAASMLASELCRRIEARHLACPVWGWTLPPDAELPAPIPRAARLDISAYLPAKRRAIAAHRSQITGMIDDSPHGFRLTAEMLATFDRPWEVFLAP
jgi:LmbE family N-acetylglucosaminyl deacetylase